ncbi:hypothetical protein MAR_032416 [Mya arenaria]|uniref:Uncharacterized protein n=1 Tax=Mya arenaria TaxID=6604 RepID=A0ABY7F872_MYAAR|nr:hypothetical protein MAR_032416 [Mya arenaria]
MKKSDHERFFREMNSRPLGEPMLSCSVVVVEADVEYGVVEEGSHRKRQKLVRQEALGGGIVEGNMLGVFKDGDFNIPRPANLMRRVNRSHQKVCPKAVDTDYLLDDFVIGDVRVGDERHLMFATPCQLKFLGQTRRCLILQKLIEVLDEEPKVDGCVMDFEAGLWQALRSGVFREDS